MYVEQQLTKAYYLYFSSSSWHFVRDSVFLKI